MSCFNRATRMYSSVLLPLLIAVVRAGASTSTTTVPTIYANFSIKEDNEPPSVLGAINITQFLTSSSDKVLYYVDEEDPFCATESCIDVDRNNGLVTVRRSLDREDVCPDLNRIVCTMLFKVGAKIKNVDETTVNIQVELTIQDENDYTPSFDKSIYTLEVPEDQRPNTIIQPELPLPVDLDGPRYRVTDCLLEMADGNSTASLPFELDKIRMVVDGSSLIERVHLRLRPGASLDHERAPSYTFILRARDGPAEDLVYKTATATIRVLVLDVNDNDPLVLPSYIVRVPENEPVGTRILRVEASDADSGKNGELVFSILANDRPRIGQHLELNASSGEIWNKRPFNYEQRNQFNFSVVVTDRGSPARSATTSISIFVTDVNDERPQICTVQDESDSNEACQEINQLLIVQENRPPDTLVVKLRVSDADSNPQFRELACTLLSTSEPFDLQRLPTEFGRNVHYALRTKLELDREQRATYSLPLMCVDGTNSTAQNTTLNLLIKVGDENDNAPLFDTTSVTIAHEEEEPLAMHLKLASDADEAENGTVRYALLDDFGKFRIHPETALLSSTALDREEQIQYELVIIAHDLGNITRLNSSITYTLTLIDKNDHAPIVQPLYIFHIAENAFADGRDHLVKFGNLNVSDPDDGENCEFICELEGQQTTAFSQLPFSVYSNCEVIFTAMTLDRELTGRYNGTVTVRDNGNPSLTSTTTVSVIIDDVNDCAPKINYPLNGTNVTFFVSLNAASQSQPQSIVTVSAKDADEPNTPNSKLQFAFTGSVALSSLFTINSDTGEIRLRPNRTLSSEDLAPYRVDVIVRDSGEPQLGSWVSFRIILKESENELSVFGFSEKPLSNVFMFVGIVVGFLLVASVLITAILFTAKRIRIRKAKERQSRTPAKGGLPNDASCMPLNSALTYSLGNDSAACSPNGADAISCLMCDSLTMKSTNTCLAVAAANSNVSVNAPGNSAQVCTARTQRVLVGASHLNEHVLIEAKDGNEDQFGTGSQHQQPICEHCYVHSYPACLQMPPGTPYCTVIPNAVSCHCPSDEGFSQTRTTDSNTSSVIRFPAICQDHAGRIDQGVPPSAVNGLHSAQLLAGQPQSPRRRAGSYTSMPVDALYFNNPNYNLLTERQLQLQNAVSSASTHSPPSAFVPKPLFPSGAPRHYGTLKKVPNTTVNGTAGRSTPLSPESDCIIVDAPEKAYSTTQSFARLQLGSEKKSSTTNLQMTAINNNHNHNNNNNNNTHTTTLNTQTATVPDCIQSSFSDSTVV